MKKIKQWISHLREKRQPGIRNRIMLHLVLFVAFVIVLLWVFQIVLLDHFYSMYKRQQVQAVADAVIQNIGNDDLATLAEHLSTQNDMCIMLLDESNHLLINAEGLRKCLIHRMAPPTLAWWKDRAAENDGPVIDDFDMQPFVAPGFNPRRFVGQLPSSMEDHSQSMLYVRQVTLSSGEIATLMLNAKLTPVTSTVDALRYQLGWITVIVLAAALGVAFVLSKHISRPIEDTNAAARELAHSRYQPSKRARRYREISELNDTLAHAAEELSKVETLQHELIANISHDLRTPLTMIGGYAEMMRDLPGESTPENMQVIMDETSRLTTLVNELLDFSRLQSGSTAIEPSSFCLTDAVESMIGRIGKLTEKDGYIIRLDADAQLYVNADEKRIGQVVYNLIGNALTYTGADKTVIVHQQQLGNAVRISVKDSGKGIPADELALIWNRYYRAKESHRRAIVGSGLGLNIVRAILDQHHANYGVDSTPADGSTFWFELPLEPRDL